MTITFYNNSSDIRVLNKSISQVGEALSVQLTEEATVEDPSFKLTMNNSIINCNYLYVSEWDSYYFIRNREILNGNELVLNCHIDVLMSFKDAILNSEIIAERSASNNNAYIVDNLVGDRGTIKQYFRKVSTTPFSTETLCYVLSVAGK